MSYNISIITPSRNMLPYLKCCAASIADQEGVQAEHIVIDGNSTDGTREWLSGQSNIRYISEQDKGMYDAINKGFKMSHGDIVAYLNCDEQYLPGTLEFVKEYFNTHPDVDVLFGDFLVVNPDGSLVSYRKAFKPRFLYIAATHLYVFTCTMFLRKKVIDDGLMFDTSFRSISDVVFVLELLRRGYKIEHVKKYLAVFTLTGSNQSFANHSFEEIQRLRKNYSPLLSIFKPLINLLRVFERFINGGYRERFPLIYSIYLLSGDLRRKKIICQKGSALWKYRF